MSGGFRHRLSSFLIVSLFPIASLGLGAGPVLAVQPDVPGGAPHSVVVPGRYIVVLRDDVPSAAAVARDLAASHGIAVSHVYEHALKGFAADVPVGRLLALQHDPRVAYVEPDQTAHIFQQTVPTGVNRIFAVGNEELGINGTDDFRVDVDVAVIDTGIADHPDLNVVGRTDCSGGGPFKQSCTDNAGTDGNGHGTHVAGTIGALDNGFGVVGVAPGARLWSVKVLGNNGSGYISWIIAGVDWVTAHAKDIEVANMSLGCECSSTALDTAITNSVAAGVVYAVAAGNSSKDAATFSPANHPDVITVSALADFDGQPGGLGSPTCREDKDDTLANFSNYGTLINVAAPGVCILSTWNDGGYKQISGTSMAAPHVAGAAALLASMTKPQNKAAIDEILATIVAKGNLDWTDDSGDGIKERLLDVSDTSTFKPTLVAGQGSGGDTEESVDQPPATTLAMGVSAITFSSSRHLDVVVNIRADSNENGTLDSGEDTAVAGAAVTLSLSRKVDDSYACVANNCWDFMGNTDSSGNFKVKLLHAPAGWYKAEVTGLVRSGHEWDSTLDGENNPAEFEKK